MSFGSVSPSPAVSTALFLDLSFLLRFPYPIPVFTMAPSPTAFLPTLPLRGVARPIARRSAATATSRPLTCAASPPPAVGDGSVTRRSTLAAAAAAALAAALPRPPAASAAAATAEAAVTDTAIGFSYTPPPAADFAKSDTAISGGRRLTVYTHNTSGSDSNLSVVATGVSSDFTQLTSFGSVDNVAKTILGGGGKGVTAEMLAVDKRPADNAYVFEYKMQIKDGPTRRLLTVFSLQPGSWIITLTAQAREEEWPSVEKELRAAINSYKLLQQ